MKGPKFMQNKKNPLIMNYDVIGHTEMFVNLIMPNSKQISKPH